MNQDVGGQSENWAKGYLFDVSQAAATFTRSPHETHLRGAGVVICTCHLHLSSAPKATLKVATPTGWSVVPMERRGL